MTRNGAAKHNSIELNKQYFDSHRGQIDEVVRVLEDDFSKETYIALVKYRETHDVRYQPPYNVHNQYFPKDIISFGDQEIVVDCGAFTGDTVSSFLKYSRLGYERYIAFEPSEKNSRVLMNAYPEVTTIKKAVWECETTMSFSEADGASSINILDSDEDNQNDLMVECVRIDDCEECRGATFIKMDLEGAEQKALAGASNTISQFKPVLAICIYHSAEDMVEIPLMLHEMYPFYRLFVRHHGPKCAETVLYGIPAQEDR